MPSETGHAAQPFSIFISYASGDRPQARLLGATLEKAGLDVWFDEEELAGGDAWDAKIRQQIRTCTYFMPVISATTEARREGYFRREWRLAVERTLDLADDVMFLVPVVIDGTAEYQARVPEKFTTVQWLRCPGGLETPQLVALARRLASPGGEAPRPTAPRAAAPPPLSSPPPKAKRREPSTADGHLPPFPAFPPFPEAGHRERFAYDVIVWTGHTIRALWVRMPRWLRVIAMVMIVFKLINAVFDVNTTTTEDPPQPTKQSSAPAKISTKEQIKDALGEDSDGHEVASKIISAATAALDSLQSGRPLAVLSFATTDASVDPVASTAYVALRKTLAAHGPEGKITFGSVPLPAGYTDAEALTRASVLKCRWLLASTVEPAGDDNFSLIVNLYDTTTGKSAFFARRTGARDDAAALATALANEILSLVKFDEPAAPPPAPAAAPAN